MKRKNKEKRIIVPDPVYNDETIAKFINQVMRKGKKSIAMRIVYNAFDIIKEKTKKDPTEIFKKALENTGPLLEVKPMWIGGATYQVPREVAKERSTTLAMRWIISSAKNKKGKSMGQKLGQELILASQNSGDAIKRKENMHKMAEANRAFAHFAR